MSNPVENASLRIRNVTEINETPRPVQIKEEPVDQDNTKQPEIVETQLPGQPSDITTAPVIQGTSENVEEPVQIKVEGSAATPRVLSDPPVAEGTSTDVQKQEQGKEEVPSIPVAVVSPTVRAQRPCCRYGIKCYRQNASHREAEAHPGDRDYKLPDYPPPPPGCPQCPYGAACYRRNPAHFQQFSHSGSPTKPTANAKPPPAKKRRRQYYSEDDSDDDGEDLADFLNDDSADEDPYADGSDEDECYDPDED